MVQIAANAAGERSPASVSPSAMMMLVEDRARTYSEPYRRRSSSRMSNASDEDGEEEEEDVGGAFRDRASSDTKTSSSDVSMQSAPSARRTASESPKSEGFSTSPMSGVSSEDNQTINRMRAVLDLSMPSAFSRKTSSSTSTSASAAKDYPTERRPSFSNALVPPYSPLSSSAGSLSSSSSGSPSVSPEAQKMDEVSVAYLAAMAKDSRVPAAKGGSEFDLPKNFYGYYVYQMELASRYNQAKNNAATISGGSSPRNGASPPLIGKVRPMTTVKTEAAMLRDDEVVSYGSLLEQALRNGLKRSPSEMPAGSGAGHAEKKAKTAATTAAPPVPQAVTPPPVATTNLQQQLMANSANVPTVAANGGNSRSSSNGQVSVEDVAKTSLRELLHNKQMQDAKVAAMAQIHHQYQAASEQAGGSRNGSRSSSPSVNLKSLLETHTAREAMKGHVGQHPQQQHRPSEMACLPFAAVVPPRHSSQQQQLQQQQQQQQQQMPPFQNGKHHLNQPMLYPHILNSRSSSPVMRERAASDASASMMRSAHSPAHHAAGLFKHKKLLEWTAADVRDWVSTLTYCSEFADIFLQQSVDGVALTLLNETHLMKNFGMKLGPAIKLRCAVWEILGLSQAASAPLPQMPMMSMSMPHFMAQKPIPVGHCIPQHHGGALPK